MSASAWIFDHLIRRRRPLRQRFSSGFVLISRLLQQGALFVGHFVPIFLHDEAPSHQATLLLHLFPALLRDETGATKLHLEIDGLNHLLLTILFFFFQKLQLTSLGALLLSQPSAAPPPA